MIAAKLHNPTWSVALAICGFVSVFPGSVLGLDPTKSLNQYVRQDLTTQNGLPADDIHAITQTRDGYLWVGTEEGLARFDGARFDVFDKASGNLPGNYVFCLFEDSHGALWIGTNGGLTRYQSGRFQTIDIGSNLPNTSVHGIAEDQEGTLWISANHMLYRYRDGSFAVFDPAQQAADLDGVVDVTVDKNNAVWVVLKGGLIYEFRDTRFEAVPQLVGLKGQPLERISSDSEGAIWISDFGGGAYRYQDGQLTAFGQQEGLSSPAVSRIIRDRAGSIWLGTSLGLARIANGKCTLFHSTGEENLGMIEAVFEDREGNLWAGSGGTGLHRFTDASFTSFGIEEGVSGGEAKALCEDSDHKLWLATGDGIYYREGQRFVRTLSAKDSFGGEFIWCSLLADRRDQSLWIGTAYGLFQYKRGNLTRYTIDDGLPSNLVMSFCLDGQGSLWIGTDYGLVCFQEGKFVTPPKACEETTHGKQIRTLVEDREGDLWIGTQSGPIRYKDGKIEQFGYKDGLTSISCLEAYVSDDGVLWFSIWNGGLARYDGKGFFTYSQKDGVPSDQICAIADDPDRGDLWLGSEEGVFRVSQRQLDDFRAGRVKHIFGTTFGSSDGLKFAVAGDGRPNGVRTQDGDLWWCLDQGVAMVNPNSLRLHQAPGPTVIESVIADQRPLIGSDLELPPGTRRLEIGYASLTYAAPEKIQFRYRLDGVDQNWFDAGPRREATFTSLRRGHYRFRVEASVDGGTSWETQGAEITFYVRPYFYETGWFVAACVILIAGLVWLAFVLRRRRLEAHFRGLIAERVRVAGEIHDSLAQGFASAAMLLDSLDRLVSSDSLLRLRLESIRRILGTSLTDARAMIATLRGQPAEKKAFELELRKLVELLQPVSSAPIELDLGAEAIPQVPAAIQKELARICQEGVNNAIRHANARKIWIKLRFEDRDTLQLVIGDDGKGFEISGTDASTPNTHFGLKGMRERAQRIGAQLQIRSQPGKGTELELDFRFSKINSSTIKAKA